MKERARLQVQYRETDIDYVAGGCLAEAFVRTICTDRDKYWRYLPG
jgi:hypothetical protein